MKSLRTGAALCLAALLAFGVSYETARAQPPAPATAAAPSDVHIVRRQSRVMHMIRIGHAEGWLDHKEADAADRALRRLRDRESEMRSANGGELTAQDRSELAQGLDDLIEDLHWTRLRKRAEPYRPR